MTFLPRYAADVVAKAWGAEHRRGLLNAWIDGFAGVCVCFLGGSIRVGQGASV